MEAREREARDSAEGGKGKRRTRVQRGEGERRNSFFNKTPRHNAYI